MTRKLGLGIVSVIAVSAMLASCLVDHKAVKSYSMPPSPHQLPVYKDGHYINFAYDFFFVQGASLRTPGYLQWKWELASLQKPFNGGLLIAPLMRFVVTEAPDGGENKAVQYISQHSNGSMDLHATEGFGVTVGTIQKNGYWVSPGAMLNVGTEPATNQILWSPLDEIAGNQAEIIEDGKKITDFYLAGPCNSSLCPDAATVTFSEFKVNGAPFEEVETPIGKFQTYRVDYAGAITITQAQSQIPLFDFRMSCWKIGERGTVTFNGSLWIYPPIGPVQIENACIFDNVNTYYSAKVDKTNLPY